MRKPFSLTYVTYEEGDAVGLACALLALAPVFIIVSYATLLVSRRDVHVAYVLVGQLANKALNDALKAYFKDEMDKELGNDGWRLVVKMKKVYGIL